MIKASSWVATAVVATSVLAALAIAPVSDGPASLDAQGTLACSANAKPAKLDFTMKDAAGADVRLSDYRGKVIVLNFWATWCSPCRAEIVDLVALQAQYGSQGLQVFGISVDDTADKLQAAIVSFKTNYPLLIGLDRNDVQDTYGPIWGVPRTFVISRTGKICRRYSGVAARDKIEAAIVALLKQKPSGDLP